MFCLCCITPELGALQAAGDIRPFPKIDLNHLITNPLIYVTTFQYDTITESPNLNC